jgi:hypothetical protein
VEKLVIMRKRPIPIRVMLSSAEKEALSKAADETGVALSVYVRMMALEAMRKREANRAA